MTSDFISYYAKMPIALIPGMKSPCRDAERLYDCTCGEHYQVWAKDVEEANKIENGDIVVLCPYCMRTTTEAKMIHKHSGDFYNASYPAKGIR